MQPDDVIQKGSAFPEFDPSSNQVVMFDKGSKEMYVVDLATGKASSLTSEDQKVSEKVRKKLEKLGQKPKKQKEQERKFADIARKVSLFLTSPDVHEYTSSERKLLSEIAEKAKNRFNIEDDLVKKEALSRYFENLADNLDFKMLSANIKPKDFDPNKLNKSDKKFKDGLEKTLEETKWNEYKTYEASGLRTINEGLTRGVIGQDWMRYLSSDAVTFSGVPLPQRDFPGGDEVAKCKREAQDYIEAFLNILNVDQDKKVSILGKYIEIMENETAESQSDPKDKRLQRFATEMNDFQGWLVENGHTSIARLISGMGQPMLVQSGLCVKGVLKASLGNDDVGQIPGGKIVMNYDSDSGVLRVTTKAAFAHRVEKRDKEGNLIVGKPEKGDSIRWQVRIDQTSKINLNSSDPRWEGESLSVKVGIPADGGQLDAAQKMYKGLAIKGFEPKTFVCPSIVTFGEQI